MLLPRYLLASSAAGSDERLPMQVQPLQTCIILCHGKLRICSKMLIL